MGNMLPKHCTQSSFKTLGENLLQWNGHLSIMEIHLLLHKTETSLKFLKDKSTVVSNLI